MQVVWSVTLLCKAQILYSIYKVCTMTVCNSTYCSLLLLWNVTALMYIWPLCRNVQLFYLSFMDFLAPLFAVLFSVLVCVWLKRESMITEDNISCIWWRWTLIHEGFMPPYICLSLRCHKTPLWSLGERFSQSRDWPLGRFKTWLSTVWKVLWKESGIYQW